MNAGVVLDTSVVLNLLGSGHVETVLAAIPGRRVVVEVASGEVLRHPLHETAGDHLAPLVAAGVVERIPLPQAAFDRFVELTGASPPDDLDDGEAATIATAEVLGLAAALDERKGRRVARSRTPSIPLLCSVEIFAMPEVDAALSGELVDAVFSACVSARMRVAAEHEGWVRRLLGPMRVAECPSLKKRYASSQSEGMASTASRSGRIA
jgi:predicted nucleic acid-binding protein